MLVARPLFLIAIFFIAFLSACQNKERNTRGQDTPVSGEIAIAVDESLHPLIEAEVLTFEGIYELAHIRARYVPETEAIQQLLDDSVRTAILTRQLTPDEAKAITDRQLNIDTIAFAVDAVALIVNKDNPDTLLNYDQLVKIARGEVNSWNQINPNTNLTDINVVFDNSNSGIVRIVKDSLARVAKLPPNCFALNSNPKVIDYVSTHKNALGLIGVGWISDRDDSLSRSFLRNIKVVALSGAQPKGERTEYYLPFQAEIKLKQYPLYRKVYVVSRENRSGLGSGFSTFLASDPGQRIVQKSGLLPITMPTRIIKLGDESRLKQEMQQE